MFSELPLVMLDLPRNVSETNGARSIAITGKTPNVGNTQSEKGGLRMTIIDILAYGVLATFIALGIIDVFLMIANKKFKEACSRNIGRYSLFTTKPYCEEFNFTARYDDLEKAREDALLYVTHGSDAIIVDKLYNAPVILLLRGEQ